mgnify:FL=1
MPKKNKCPLEYARGIYQGEGYFTCTIHKKERRARLTIGIGMYDKDALNPLESCFGTKVHKYGKTYRIEQMGEKALELAKLLAVTPTKKQQIETTLEKCRKLWKQGYTDHIEE